jgi:hypothetical protein
VVSLISWEILVNSSTVLSRYLVARAGPETRVSHSNFSSWARNIPNFFSTAIGGSHFGTVATTRQRDQPQALSTIKSTHSTTEGSTTPDVQLHNLPNTHRPELLAARSLEKGQTPSPDTQDCMSPGSEDGLIVRDQRRSTATHGSG